MILHAKTTNKIAIGLMWFGGVIAVVILVLIVLYLLVRGVPHIVWSFFTTRPAPGIDGGRGCVRHG